MKKQFKHILFLLLAFSLSACYEDGSCNENTDTGINVKVSNSGRDSDTDLDGLDESKAVTWDFLKSGSGESFVSSQTVSYSSGISLDMNDTTITVLFNIKDASMTDYLTDTVVFNYRQTDLRLISLNCGFAPIYEITEIYFSQHVLDSVVFYSDVEVSNDTELKNVAFYY